MSINYIPSVTGEDFLNSRKFVKGAMGPVGGGKSTLALMDLIQRSFEQEPYDNVRMTKHLIVRNTRDQLKFTVKPIIDAWLVTMVGGTMGQWKLTDNTFELRCKLPDETVVQADFLLLAADTPDDVRRLLSLEVSDAWLEESRELAQEIVEGVLGRIGRFPSQAMGGVTYPGMVFSTNPPPIGSYWHDKLLNPPANWEVFIQPPALLDDGSINPLAENLENLPPEYYDNLIDGKSEDWIDVFLKNKFGLGNAGKPLYKASFKKSFHVSNTSLKPVMVSQYPLVLGQDNGLTAATAIMQRDARGRVNILGECYVPEGQSMGMETYIDRLLIPYLSQKFPFRRSSMVVELDPACFQRSQIDEKTIDQAFRMRGFTTRMAPTNDPERRQQAVESLLTMQIDGGPALLIDPECQHIINTMEFGHHYKKSQTGIVTTIAEKNFWSHMGDGIQYGCLFYTGVLTMGGRFAPTSAARKIVRPKSPYVYA